MDGPVTYVPTEPPELYLYLIDRVEAKVDQVSEGLGHRMDTFEQRMNRLLLVGMGLLVALVGNLTVMVITLASGT